MLYSGVFAPGGTSDCLLFENERQLSEKPLGIDVLVIKLKEDIRIQKNIGRIFRKHNIIEYKSPEDYMSINDYYKTLAYVCLYQSNTPKITDIRPEELTMTLVCSHFPRKLVKHLEAFWKVKPEPVFPGGYYLTGSAFPTQILVVERLSGADNFWLSRMRTDLDVQKDLEPLGRVFRENQKDSRYGAVMDLLLRANYEKAEEAKSMCDAIRELFADEFAQAEKEAKEKWEKRGANRVNQLNTHLLLDNRLEDLTRSAQNPQYQELLYKEYGL